MSRMVRGVLILMAAIFSAGASAPGESSEAFAPIATGASEARSIGVLPALDPGDNACALSIVVGVFVMLFVRPRQLPSANRASARFHATRSIVTTPSWYMRRDARRRRPIV